MVDSKTLCEITCSPPNPNPNIFAFDERADPGQNQRHDKRALAYNILLWMCTLNTLLYCVRACVCVRARVIIF